MVVALDVALDMIEGGYPAIRPPLPPAAPPRARRPAAMGFEPVAEPRNARHGHRRVVANRCRLGALNREICGESWLPAQGKMAGPVLRVGHLGGHPADIVRAIRSSRRAPLASGLSIEPGAGPRAARAVTAEAGRPGVRILVADRWPTKAGAPTRRSRLCAEPAAPRTPGAPGRLPGAGGAQRKVDAELLAAGTSLAVVGRAGTGLDNIDVTAAEAAGITVVNAPDANTVAAAEHALGLLFALARHIAAADASLRRGEWRRSDFVGTELSGKTLGIVGLGRIGLAVATRAGALEMTLLGADPYVSAERAAEYGVLLVELDELISRSDFVTLHVPLSSATRGVITRPQLDLMKPTAALINTARGGLVDETALAEALTAGRLAGAAVDVFSDDRCRPICRCGAPRVPSSHAASRARRAGAGAPESRPPRPCWTSCRSAEGYAAVR